MAKEVDIQKRIVDAIKAEGGMAQKMAHAFFVGVPDLLVKFRSVQAAVIEVKQKKLTSRSLMKGVTVELSAPQHRWLRNAAECGMPAFALIVVQLTDRNNEKWYGVVDIRRMSTTRYHLTSSDIYLADRSYQWAARDLRDCIFNWPLLQEDKR